MKNEINWKEAPEWANYMAEDADGYSYWYEKKPILSEDEKYWYEFQGRTEFIILKRTPYCIKRPKDE